ncbi:MAG: hypothetical protein HKN46_05045 [Acidimicrobiia bacterium]|nr:hypothetical protein [Acidimicrobiia bacterium]
MFRGPNLARVEIGTIFYPPDRQAWHTWLDANHATEDEIWVKRYLKATGVPTISYDDLVEECLCFGWIDGVIKKTEPESNVQRVTPRRKHSFLSELNRQRVWKLEREGRMTDPGRAALGEQVGAPEEPELPDWMEAALRADAQAWDHWTQFPLFYRRLKVGWITEPKGPSRQGERDRRLAHLVARTAEGRRYGTEPLRGVLYEVDHTE